MIEIWILYFLDTKRIMLDLSQYFSSVML